MKPTVTFETKCYENDFEFILKKNKLERMIDHCAYEFDEKVVFINNVNNIKLVKNLADKLVSQKVIDQYVVVNDYAEEALKYFQLNKESFKGGYYYSIAELVSIYLAKTDYLLHFSSDSFLPFKTKSNWIQEGIQLIDSGNGFFTANPHWNDYKEAKMESFGENENFFFSSGFSDQCYLVKTSWMKEDIYKFNHAASSVYPVYGGELFEKRVFSYIKSNNLKRLTSKKCYYISINYPKSGLRRVFRKLLIDLNLEHLAFTFDSYYIKKRLRNKLLPLINIVRNRK